MKNKTPKDHFQTHCWAYKVIADPYQVFAECFFFADIGAYRKTIRRVFCLQQTIRSIKRKNRHRYLTRLRSLYL